MTCKISISKMTNDINRFDEFRPGVPGGSGVLSFRLSASCDEEEAVPEIRGDEDLAWYSSFISGDHFDRLLTVRNSAGDSQDYSGWILDVNEWNSNIVGFRLKLSTAWDGAQTVDVRVMCRCAPDQNWTRLAVDIPFSV
jgi:hypothetical protein